MSILRATKLILGATALAAGPAAANDVLVYEYDVLGRLVSVNSTGTVNAGRAYAIGYDPAGNRSSYSVVGAPAPTGPLPATIAPATSASTQAGKSPAAQKPRSTRK